MALTAADIKDIVTGTLKELGPPRFEQIAQELQDYEVMGRWLKNDKVTFDSGYGIQRTLMTKLAGSAKHVGLYEKDNVNIVDLLTSMSIRWAQAQAHWGYEFREGLYNRGKSLIVNMIKPRRQGAMIDLAEELEEKAWTLLDPDDKVSPYGIPYWIVKNGTAGFNGGAPTGYTTVAGINPTTTPKWKNYTDAYTNITKADLIKKMRKAARKVAFKSPVDIPDLRLGKGDRFRIYTNEESLSSIEDVGEAQNENLGRDVASMDGQIVFKKNPIIWVPYLDSDTTDPFYMINHDTFYPVILRGDYLRETGPDAVPGQHNVFVVFVDLSYNYICIDRRRNAVLSK